MRRLAFVLFNFLVAGLTSPAFAIQPGDHIGPNIVVLSQAECKDVNGHEISPPGDAPSNEESDEATPSTPATPSNIDPKDLDKKSFNLGLFNFKPDGAPNRIRRDECSADHLRDLMLQNSEINAQSKVVENFFATCHTTVKRQGDGDLGALLKTASMVYNSCSNPRIHAVEVSLRDGTKLRAVLALQDSTRPLPFVIFKDGVFGNSNSSSSRAALMALFDQAPINMLVLGSVTGSDYLHDNKHIALGGFDEGMQVVEVAKMLRSSELAPRISEVELFGISLGGEAALYASYYNSWQPLVDGRAPLASIFAMSPVVNLQSAMNSLFSPGVKWKVIRKLIMGDFFKILGQLPFLSQTLTALNNVADTTEMPAVIAQGAVGYYSHVSPTWGLPPYTGLQIQTTDELWGRNNFLPIAQLKLTTPTFVLGANSDMIVDSDANSLALKAEVEKVPGTSIKVVMLDRGNHCAFGPALGWDLYSAFMISYEISHSPTLMARRHEESAPIDDEYLKKFGKLNDDEMTVAYHFNFDAKKDYMKITVDQIDDEQLDDQACGDMDPELLGSNCLRRKVVKIPIDELPSWARQPVNPADAQALTRWVNTNVRLVSADGTGIGRNNKNPAAFKWISYE